jgi:hypothetical protein
MISRAILIALLPIVTVGLGCSSESSEPGNSGGRGGAGGAGATGGGGAGGTGGGAGGAGGGGAPPCPFPYDGWNGNSPTVSLRNDLLAGASQRPQSGGGVMRRACAFSSCHNDTSVEAQLFLGPGLRDREQNEIALTDAHVTRLLGATDGVLRASRTIPSMQLVKPGDPANSFLMRKIDGCFTDIQSMCTPLEPDVGPCGEGMPAGSEPLSAEERDLFRRWIAQGAQNN